MKLHETKLIAKIMHPEVRIKHIHPVKMCKLVSEIFLISIVVFDWYLALLLTVNALFVKFAMLLSSIVAILQI